MTLERGKMAVRQLAVLAIVYTIGDAVLIIPSYLTAEAGQDAWIAALLSAAAGTLLVFLYYALGSRYPDMTLVEYSERILGKWLGKVVSFLYLFFFLYLLCAFFVREISDFMATQIMPETPIQATMILFLGIVVIGVRLGLETIARTAEIFLPWIIMLFFIMVLFLLPDIQIEKIQPVLEEGIKPVLRASYTFVAIPFMELAAFLMILPYVNEKHKLTKNFYFAAWIGGMVTIVTTVLCILVLGAEVTTRSSYASYVLAKKISIGDFLERLEVIIAIIWLLTIFFKLAICFYGVALGLAQMLKLKDYRPLLLPLAMILVVLSIIITPNVIHYNFFTARIWPLQDLAFGCLLPLLLLSVDVIRKRKKKLMNNK